MNKHRATFSDTIRARTKLAGLKTRELVKKASIPASTYTKRMKDGKWTRAQVMALHQVLHFTAEDLQIFIEGR